MGAESRNDSGLSKTEICLLSGRATVDVAAPSPEWSGVEFMSSTESDPTHMAAMTCHSRVRSAMFNFTFAHFPSARNFAYVHIWWKGGLGE